MRLFSLLMAIAAVMAAMAWNAFSTFVLEGGLEGGLLGLAQTIAQAK